MGLQSSIVYVLAIFVLINADLGMRGGNAPNIL